MIIKRLFVVSTALMLVLNLVFACLYGRQGQVFTPVVPCFKEQALAQRSRQFAHFYRSLVSHQYRLAGSFKGGTPKIPGPAAMIVGEGYTDDFLQALREERFTDALMIAKHDIAPDETWRHFYLALETELARYLSRSPL